MGGSAKMAVLAGAAAGLVSGERAMPSTAPARHTPGLIIDSHIHCGGNESWVAEMVEIYGQRKVMACVLTWRKDMDLMVEAMKSHPHLFIGYGRVDPDDPLAIREIEAFKKNGFVGMKFHSPRKNWDDPCYFHLYRQCEEYGLLMLFHTGISSHSIGDEPQWGSTARMRPVYLDTICRLFPRAIVQGAHLGNPWYDEAAEVARWNPNLYWDVTGSTLIKLIRIGRLDRMREILWWSSDESADNPHTLKDGPGAWEHIVFGTDEEPAGLESNIDRFQQMLDANQVPPLVRDRMWGLTLARLLRIDPKTRRIQSHSG